MVVKTGISELQKDIKTISGNFHKETVNSAAFFYALLMEQIGQCARKFMHHSGQNSDIAEDITDIIVGCLCYLNWLGADGNHAWKKSFDKHKKNIELLIHAR